MLEGLLSVAQASRLLPGLDNPVPLAGMKVKSVQFPLFTLSGAGPTWGATISAVDTTKTAYCLLHDQYRSNYAFSDVWAGRLQLINATTLRLNAGDYFDNGAEVLTVRAMVVEFEGDVSVQVATATFTPTTSESTTNATIVAVGAKAFILGLASKYFHGDLGVIINVNLVNATTVGFTHKASKAGAYSHTAACCVVNIS